MLTLHSLPAQLDDLLGRICMRLQLSSLQHALAEQRYSAVGAWLEAESSPLAPLGPKIYPQGSLRIGTTVRPLGREEYDLDLVCEFEVDRQRIGHPVVLLDAVELRLKQHATYRPMVERKNRCIRLKYANEFHLDILPACSDRKSGPTCIVVPDRGAMSWKPSNPIGYADWFESRAALAQAVLIERAQPLPDQEPVEAKAPLKLVVQLLKRWRDNAYTRTPELAPISIVLTTLAGQLYAGEQSVSVGLSQTLQGIRGILPATGERLIVRNPANPAEDLSETWSQNPHAYRAFVDGLVEFDDVWQEVGRASGVDACARLLERLFGEDATKEALREQAAIFTKARTEGRLSVGRNVGIVSGASSGAVPIRRNTFYGG